ncbi:DEAD/DEAH box helicase [Alkaliphilus sp. MSJ-5]|uniref:DEAD/DEAH box helicase n=1 Tax=Alkaliphilus flagellatus TaxID=2841507 RepID=A0ABS6FZ82_9FIRM|nr:DEAD/DEAH box helicase [Alkaliphilus flagellatus]MBU5675545.1 DEAD/DEAH box helicase [Alkaliphilus flagellatus]
MFNLNEENIYDMSTESITYKKGKGYFTERRVKSLIFNQENLSFSAIVQGTRKYNVKIGFIPGGNVKHTTCSCSAYDKYWGICKHIVAVLLTIMHKDREGQFSKVAETQHIKNILSFYRNKQHSDFISLNMEITFELKISRYNKRIAGSFISLKVGEGRTYVVRNIKGFIECIYNKNKIEFGKNFIFDPNIHSFSSDDQKIIDLIAEIYEHEKTFEEDFYKDSSQSIFNGKYIKLPEITLKRFLNIIKDGDFISKGRFNAIILEEAYDNIVINEKDIPFRFQLDKDKENIVLKVEHDGLIIPITSDGDYFFSNGEICKISKYQKENLLPFYSILTKHKGSNIVIEKDMQESFFSEIYPIIKCIGKVEIEKKLEEVIYSPELKIETYFDRAGRKVTADVNFIYDQIKINPFKVSRKNNIEKDKVLIRDLENERKVISFLENSNFKIKNREVYLEDEEDIFKLVYERLKCLQDISEVYYSNSFKMMEARKPPSFKGGIRLNKDEGFLEFNFEIDEVDDKELNGLLKSLRQRKKYYRLKDGSFIPLDNEHLISLDKMMLELDLDNSNLRGKTIEIPKYRGLYIDELLRDKNLSFIKKNKNFRNFVEDIRKYKEVEYNVPEGLNGTLRDYQKLGFKWLKTLSYYGLGGILADDMGLGKTFQVLAYLVSEKKESKEGTALVVAPTSLVYNWLAEIEKFTPSLKAAVVVGNKEERKQIIEKTNEYDIIITSYPLIRRDVDLYENLSFKWCILDEAQHIKNPSSQNARCVKSIKASHRFALTGTPIENSLTELWSIVDFIMPGYLLSYNKFQNKYEKMIVKEENEDVLKSLRRQISPFVLRRLKKHVLNELPEKIENIVFAELSPEQKKLYVAYLKKIQGEIEEEIKENGFERSQIKILAALTRLRQICCHPALFLENYKGTSGKFELLQEIIENSIEGNHRILLFSQFTSMLAMIKDMLEKLKVSYYYLDGSTPIEERGNMVNDFNNGSTDIFLISLKAGGTGLNLTGADMVIHFDPWWNPAVEEQATDRAYRIGQKNVVHVMKLITKGTIEEKISKLQDKKRELIDGVIQPGETLISKISKDELMELFRDE